MWLYIDYANRVFGANPNNMEGNTGWIEVEVPENFNIDLLYDEHEAALYKIINNELVTRTEEERKRDWPQPEPTPIDPVEQIRADVDYLAMMEGVNL